MSIFRTATLCLVAATAVTAARAAQPAVGTEAVPSKEQARIAAIVQAKTGLKATAVEASPLRDFYTVLVDTSVYYVDKQGKWLFDGHLVDMQTKTSVTAQRKMALESVGVPGLDWRSLNLADAVKTVRGNAVPGRVLVTFEDPNCGFCKKLKPELEKLQNVTVFTFPIALLGTDSQAKNENLWCAKDRAAAWAATLSGQVVPASAACDLSGLTRNGALSAELKVRGTPTIFLADGSRIAGYVDAGAIEARLAAQQQR